MSVPLLIPPDMTDVDLRKIVIKDGDDRLKAELKRSQTVFDSATIDTFSRDDLVAQVTLLRRIANQTNAVNSMITAFKGLPVTGATTTAAPPSDVSLQPQAEASSMSTILTMLMQQQQMQQQSAKEEKADRERREERLMQLAKEEKAEREAKEKEEKAERQAKEEEEK